MNAAIEVIEHHAPSTELTVIERAVAALGMAGHEDKLRELAAASQSIVEITNSDGYQQAHAARMVLKNMRVDIAKAGKEARDDATAFSKAVIAEERRLIGLIQPEEFRLADLQGAWDAEREREKEAKIAAEMARVGALQGRLAELRGNPNLSPTSGSGLIADHISDLESIAVDESFQEFQAQAVEAKAAGLTRLRELYGAAVAHEAEQERIRAERAELAKLRAEQERAAAAERERIAEETRRLQSERAEQEAAARADRQRIAEEERRLADERAALERQQREAREAEERREREAREAEERRIAAEQAEAERLENERLAEVARQERRRRALDNPPSEDEIVTALAEYYDHDRDVILMWIAGMDFPALFRREGP